VTMKRSAETPAAVTAAAPQARMESAPAVIVHPLAGTRPASGTAGMGTASTPARTLTRVRPTWRRPRSRLGGVTAVLVGVALGVVVMIAVRRDEPAVTPAPPGALWVARHVRRDEPAVTPAPPAAPSVTRHVAPAAERPLAPVAADAAMAAGARAAAANPDAAPPSPVAAAAESEESQRETKPEPAGVKVTKSAAALPVRRRSSAPASGTGALEIKATPFADVYVDGKLAGSTPFSRELPVGRHRVKLVGPRGKTDSVRITIRADRTARIDRQWSDE
jgi:hypothetical protein